jgi:hypothetical protein
MGDVFGAFLTSTDGPLRSRKAHTQVMAKKLTPHFADVQAHYDLSDEEVYERYMKYLTGCAKAFRIGYVDVNQFTLEKL